MELLTYARELAQRGAEHLASYKFGQNILRHLDRALWVVEKCARWAVPPPYADSPQPELVRPLPWVFFLALLVTLRITRESISLINLALGKPPLRSADVVTYIQGKRRYLRTLKYQGNRITRARTSAAAQTQEPWYRSLQSLFAFTLCFRTSHIYSNNNTTHLSHNDEVLVVKRSKRREPNSPAACSTETTMERLIEKMMVDLDADSDDDSSFTLTNATSVRSASDSECEEYTAIAHDETLTISKSVDTTQDNILEENIAEGGVACSTFEDTNHTPNETHSEGTIASSTPKKNDENESPKKGAENESPKKSAENKSPHKCAENDSPKKSAENESPKKGAENESPKKGAENESPNKIAENELPKKNVENESCNTNNIATLPKENRAETKEFENEGHTAKNKSDLSELTKPETKNDSNTDSALGESQSPKVESPKAASRNFIQGEKFSPQKTQPSTSTKNTKIGRKLGDAFLKIFSHKDENLDSIANGRLHSAHSKKKGTQRRDSEKPVEQSL